MASPVVGRNIVFCGEARALEKIDEHPNVVQYVRHDQYAGQPYLLMDFVAGPSLSRVIHDNVDDSTDVALTVPPETVKQARQLAHLFADLAGALAHLHTGGVIHCDVKPSNVVLRDGREPVLVDLGLVRGVESGATISVSDNVIGTPAYMSPEQVRGEIDLTPGTDIYSLGVSLFEAMTGRRPFDAPTTTELCRRIIEQPLPDIRTAESLVGHRVRHRPASGPRDGDGQG